MLALLVTFTTLLLSSAQVPQNSKPELVLQTGHKGQIVTVPFSPDGRWLTSESWDNTVKFWEVASGRELRTLTGHSSLVHAVAFSPDGRWLATGSWDKTVKLWEAATGSEVRTLSGHTKFVKAVAFSPDGA